MVVCADFDPSKTVMQFLYATALVHEPYLGTAPMPNGALNELHSKTNLAVAVLVV